MYWLKSRLYTLGSESLPSRIIGSPSSWGSHLPLTGPGAAYILSLGFIDIFLPQVSVLLSILLPGGFSLPQGWTWKAQLSLVLLLLLIASIDAEHPDRRGFL